MIVHERRTIGDTGYADLPSVNMSQSNFLQKELPVRFAVLGLIVPVLVMIAPWRWLGRLREIQSRQQMGREDLDQERQGC
jgi:hypothetical protein